MPRVEYERIKALLQEVLESVPSEQGRISGFVQRATKLTAVLFVQMLVLGCWQQRRTRLVDLVQVGRQLGVKISLPGLHQRINQAAVVLLRSVLQAALAQPRPHAPAATRYIFQHFSQVYVQDSSYVSLPPALAQQLAGSGGDASPAGAKVVLNYEYHTGTLAAVALVAGRTPDSRCGQAAQLASPGSLHLFDLGFYALNLLSELCAAGSYFLCRHHAQTALFSAAESADGSPQRLDLLTLLRTHGRRAAAGPEAATWEVAVYLGVKEKLPVRLIAVRLPPAVVEQRRRRLREGARRRGRTLTAETLALAAWNLFCTNVPSAWWSAEQVATAYCSRWQVELLFKLCKSQAGLDCIDAWRAERILCFFYARLIAVVLSHQILTSWRFVTLVDVEQGVETLRELSPPKAFHLLQHAVGACSRIIALHWRGLKSWLTQLGAACKALALKDKRCKKPSTFQRLAALGA